MASVRMNDSYNGISVSIKKEDTFVELSETLTCRRDSTLNLKLKDGRDINPAYLGQIETYLTTFKNALIAAGFHRDVVDQIDFLTDESVAKYSLLK